MTQLSDFEFNIAMKLGANRCLAADVDEFLSLNDETYEVSPDVEKRFSRKLRYSEWKDVRVFSAKALKIAMLVLVCGVSLFFTVTMAIQPVRAAFFGAIVTWYDEFIEVRYDKTLEEEKAEQTDTLKFEIKKPTYVPEGFEMINEFSDEISVYSRDYMDSGLGFISFTQQKDFEAGIDIDDDIIDRATTYLKNETIEANVFIYENNQYIIIWKDQYLFYIISEGIELEEVIKMAESIY